MEVGSSAVGAYVGLDSCARVAATVDWSHKERLRYGGPQVAALIDIVRALDAKGLRLRRPLEVMQPQAERREAGALLQRPRQPGEQRSAAPSDGASRGKTLSRPTSSLASQCRAWRPSVADMLAVPMRRTQDPWRSAQAGPAMPLRPLCAAARSAPEPARSSAVVALRAAVAGGGLRLRAKLVAGEPHAALWGPGGSSTHHARMPLPVRKGSRSEAYACVAGWPVKRGCEVPPSAGAWWLSTTGCSPCDSAARTVERRKATLAAKSALVVSGVMGSPPGRS
ncbi:hypothetical protein TSOC_009179 [Tetrabaena socialis]|uniref:Uncharacterized protein n=1 Tax=Tetrabaena socialis TaxID=47790 RepID=A0A2J7ZWK7_9CHLO|nr:hypothetical protein TSOC_009179 [Tetrabaena socialis]|eukprot:PNH04638.1 hypothetical protein TSOC_009179 [Tetrabaena socialis]